MLDVWLCGVFVHVWHLRMCRGYVCAVSIVYIFIICVCVWCLFMHVVLHALCKYTILCQRCVHVSTRCDVYTHMVCVVTFMCGVFNVWYVVCMCCA